MMKDECSSLLFVHPFLDLCNDGCEDGKQFVRFLDERGDFCRRDDASPNEQVQPEIGFIQFLKRGAKFVDDVGV